MAMMDTFKSDAYEDGRTKQSFKDSTDVTKILHRAARGDSISHLVKHGAVYGDFSDIDDLLTASKRLERGKQIFMQLPSEVRNEFKNDVSAFYNYVNDPANVDRLAEVLPGLAAPGKQLGGLNNPVAPVDPRRVDSPAAEVVAPTPAPENDSPPPA